MKVLKQPSVWPENAPFVIKEAFAAGAPVVASDAGGMAELVDHEKSGLLFRQGDTGVGMYIVSRGHVRISQEPGPAVLAELGEGDFFGEIALLSEKPRSATATATEATTLLGFFQPDLISILERQPRIGVAVLRGLAEMAGERLVRTEAQLREAQRQLKSLPEESEADQG